ncbi:MAG: hypothetical protein RL113_62 [Pseudomonadota bacterium]|jgi:cation diffusion facilitator family transporter
MNTLTSLKNISHSHDFNPSNPIAKKNTLYATWLTLITMIIEIIGGYHYHSMALLADGWHMSSHVLALGMAYMAYQLSDKYANDFKFNFGTYKIEVLGGYTSAILLLGVAFFMIFHSIERILNPVNIAYQEAMSIAIIGLIVNLICAWLLKEDHHHDGYIHPHHHQHHQDINLKAAYIHVLTDAFTSVLAIIALGGSMLYGLSWLDPLMGIIGSILVLVWALSLIKQSGKILLDAQRDEPVVEEIIQVINDLDQNIIIEDLHVLSVGKGKFALILTLNTQTPIEIDTVKKQLSIHEELVHVSIEFKRQID